MRIRFLVKIGIAGTVLFVGFPLLMARLNRNLGLPVFTSIYLSITGVILILLGIAIVLQSAKTLFIEPDQEMLSPFDTPPTLVTRGLFRYTRNPMYLGYFIVLLGEFFLMGEVLILGYLVVLATFTHLMVVHVEEPGLELEFGEEYVNYKSRVPRWIPRLDD